MRASRRYAVELMGKKRHIVMPRATAGAYANTCIGTPVPAAGAEGRPDEGVSGD